MKLETQMKLNSNPLYIKFIHEYSNWYKTLNREPQKINDMINLMKEKYRLRPTDKFNNIVDSVDLVSKIFKVTNE